MFLAYVCIYWCESKYENMCSLPCVFFFCFSSRASFCYRISRPFVFAFIFRGKYLENEREIHIRNVRRSENAHLLMPKQMSMNDNDEANSAITESERWVLLRERERIFFCAHSTLVSSFSFMVKIFFHTFSSGSQLFFVFFLTFFCFHYYFECVYVCARFLFCVCVLFFCNVLFLF